MTSVWVAKDSTNQPERNRSGPAWNSPSMILKEVEQGADRAEEQHKPSDHVQVPVRRRAQLLGVDRSGGW
jgi:membrane peptidoglycan carboxypeptidase